jgi:hypothetical protein
MGMEKQPLKEKLNWSAPVDGHSYTFQADDERVGDATLIYKPVERYKNSQRIYRGLIALGLEDSDKIAHLNEFYPNGRGLDEDLAENMRKGFGSTALEHLISESVNEGAKAMYASTDKRSMQRFLEKKGFVHLGDGEYVKQLNEASSKSK